MSEMRVHRLSGVSYSIGSKVRWEVPTVAHQFVCQTPKSEHLGRIWLALKRLSSQIVGNISCDFFLILEQFSLFKIDENGPK